MLDSSSFDCDFALKSQSVVDGIKLTAANSTDIPCISLVHLFLTPVSSYKI